MHPEWMGVSNPRTYGPSHKSAGHRRLSSVSHTRTGLGPDEGAPDSGASKYDSGDASGRSTSLKSQRVVCAPTRAG